MSVKHYLAVPVALVLALAFLMGCEDSTLGPDLAGDLTGQVLDFETNAPISGASVTTSPPSGALVTDGEGRFRINNLREANYTITVTRNGYQSNTVTIAVRDGQETQAVVFLQPREEDETTTPPAADLAVQLLNWTTRSVNADSVFAVVEYRVTNIGGVTVPQHEVYFRVDTDQGAFYQTAEGGQLAVGQIKLGQFQKFVGSATPSAVAVEGFWFPGQQQDDERAERRRMMEAR